MRVEDELRSALEQEASRYDDWNARTPEGAVSRGRRRRIVRRVGTPVLAVLAALVLVWGSYSVGREVADAPQPTDPPESAERVVSVSLPDSGLEAYVTVDSEETCLMVALPSESGARESRWCETGNPEFMGVRDSISDVAFVAVQTHAGIRVNAILDSSREMIDFDDFESATDNGQTVTLAVGDFQNRAWVDMSGPEISLGIELDSAAGVLETVARLPRLGEERSVVADVHDMRDKVERAGFVCDRWRADSPRGLRNTQNEQEGAVCTLYTSFMVFYTSTPSTEVRQSVRQTQNAYTSEGQTSAVVYGDNWVVDCGGNTVQCETIHQALGGTLEVVEGDPELRDGDLLPALACPTLPADQPQDQAVAFFAICNGDPGLPPVPVYRTEEPADIEEAVRALVAGTTPDEREAGYESGFDGISDPSTLDVSVTVDSAGVARVEITEDGQPWQPGSLAGTTHQLLLLLDPLQGTVFHYPDVTGLDMSTLCWGESDCTGVTTREIWESTLFINTGALLTNGCDLEAVWYDQDQCTLRAAIEFQHFEMIRRDSSDTVTMYAGPGVDYVSLAELQPGEQVAVLEHSTTDQNGNEWELILPASTIQAGWIPANTLNPTEP